MIQNRNLEQFTDEQLLFELFRRNGVHRYARKEEYRDGDFMTSTVPVGKSIKIAITMGSDEFSELVALAIGA